MVSDGLIIRRANLDDISEITMSFIKYFTRDEPLNICLNGSKSVEPNPESHDFKSNYRLTLIATISEPHNKFAGFLMSEICGPGYMDEWRKTFKSDDKTGIELFSILNELNSKFNVFERYGIDKAFHITVVSVDPELRGKSIGTKLFAESIELAKAEGEKLIFTDCTSNHTSKIAEKLGMQCIGEISYENYRNENGEKVFRANPPHTHVKRFVKLLD